MTPDPIRFPVVPHPETGLQCYRVRLIIGVVYVDKALADFSQWTHGKLGDIATLEWRKAQRERRRLAEQSLRGSSQ